MSKKEQLDKYRYISVVVVILLATAFIVQAMVNYLTETANDDFLEYDNDTVTAADYTVELDISKSAYDDFLKNHYEPIGKKQGYSPSLYLKMYLRNEVKLISAHNEQMKKNEKENKTVELTAKEMFHPTTDSMDRRTCEVFDIHFAFDNEIMINLLK